MTINIVRAWKDAAYFDSLTAEEQALVPANPAGRIDLDMSDVSGGRASAREKVGSARLAASCTGGTTCC